MHNVDDVEILLVEDNASDAELTLRALQEHHVSNKIRVVTDGEEALDYLFGRGNYTANGYQCPKLILLDLRLPLVSGLEVLRAIKQDGRTKTIPVVVLTSSAEEVDVNESYLLGVNSYIVKPVDFDKFIKSVTDLGMYWLLLNKPPSL
jgi:two-component system, response regulator